MPQDPVNIDTLAKFKATGHTLAVHCQNPVCMHRAAVDLDALIKVLGPDYPVYTPPIRSRFRCSVCGGKNLAVIVGTTHGTSTHPSGGSGQA